MAIKMDLAELVARAHVVFYGTVEEIHAQNHHREAVIRVHTVLKGAVSPQAQVRVSFVPSMAESSAFVTRERVLLFLQAEESGTFQIVGGFQGKFSLD